MHAPVPRPPLRPQSGPVIKAVIFDMDGVLVDSEPLWEKSESIILRRKGFSGNENYRKRYRKKIMGLNQKDSMKLLRDTFGIDDPPERILGERIEILLELYETELRLFDGIPELLETLGSEQEMTTALASGSPMKLIDFVLRKFSLEESFRIRVSGDCVEKGKPDPDIYLEAAQRLGLSPEECAAVEDSINGMLSAKRAGMRCIAVPDPRIDAQDYPRADVFRKSIREVTLEDIKGSG